MSYVDGIEVDARLLKPEDYKWAQLKQLSYKSNNQKLLALTDLFNLVRSQ